MKYYYDFYGDLGIEEEKTDRNILFRMAVSQIEFVQRAFSKYKDVLIKFGLHDLFERTVTLSYQMHNNTYKGGNSLLDELQAIKLEDRID